MVNDGSFSSRVGASEKPSWCNPLTDEIQIISISGCDPSLNASMKQIQLLIVGTDGVLRSLSFSCDIDSETFSSLWQQSNGNGKSVYISRTVTSSNIYEFKVGYLSSTDSTSNSPRNWYQPYVLFTSSGINVSISTFQEGGYLNSHFNYLAKPILAEVRSLWVDASSNFSFSLTYNDEISNDLWSQSFTAAQLKLVMTNITSSSIASVTRVTSSGSTWIEYKITFNVQATNWSAGIMRVFTDRLWTSMVSLNVLTTANNFPIFYDLKHRSGYSNSGRYTCYKREQNYSAFSYQTGQGNIGVLSEVSIQKNTMFLVTIELFAF